MGLARKIARRSLLQRPGRTLFSVLGIALGIATVVGVYTLDHNTVEGLKLRATTDWRPDLEVRPSGDVVDPLTELRDTEGVARASAFFQNEAVVFLEPGEARKLGGGGGRRARPGGERGREEGVVQARLIAAEAAALPGMDAYSLLAGRDLDPATDAPEALVGAPVAEALELEPGDAVLISRPRRAPPRRCVDGVMQRVEGPAEQEPLVVRFEVVGILAPEKLGRRAQGDIVLIDYEQGLRVYADTRIQPRFWVRPDPRFDVEALQSRLAGSFAYDIGRSVVVGQAADERAFRNGVLMAGLLALVLGLYVIFHTLSMSLVERVREVGTLHALGTTRAQIAKVFLLEAVALTGLGGAFGIAGGILLARGLLSQGITTLGTGHFFRTFDVPWPVVLALAALGMGMALLGSIFPLLRARNASTVDALRGEQALESSGVGRGFHLFAAVLLAGILPALYFVIVPVIGEASGALVGAVLLAVGILGLLVAVPLLVPSVVATACRLIARPLARAWVFSGRMAAANMLVNPRRIAVSTAALALVTAAFVGLKGMTRSLSAEVEVWAEEAMNDKAFARNLPKVSFDELAAKAHEYPGVLGVESGSARIYSPFLVIGLRVDELVAYGPLSRDPRLERELRENHGMILSRRIARNLGYEIGDPVHVEVGGGRVQEFRVVGISDAYGYFPHPDERMYGVVSDHYIKKYFCVDIDHPDYVAVRMDEGGDPGVVQAAVSDFLQGRGKPSFFAGMGMRDYFLVDIREDFFLFDVILGLTALLAALGVLNGQLLSALERSKEIGVLKALGATRGQIAGMVTVESAVMGVFGGLLGVGLGNLLGPVIVRALESLSGLILPLRTAGEWTALALAATLLLALLAAVYPIWRMNRSDAVRAVRTG